MTVSLLKELLVGGVGDVVYSGVQVCMRWAGKCVGGVMEAESIRFLRSHEAGNEDLPLHDCSLSTSMPNVAVCIWAGSARPSTGPEMSVI